MKYPISLSFLLVFSVSCAESGPEFPQEPTETISLQRTQGFGFCPSAQDSLQANITQKDGQWTIEATIAVPAPDGTDSSECLDPAISDDCLVESQLPSRALSEQEVEALEEAISAVPSKECKKDPNLACDPCVVTSVTVDGHQVNDQCCGQLNDEFRDGFDNLVSVVDGLSQQ